MEAGRLGSAKKRFLLFFWGEFFEKAGGWFGQVDLVRKDH